MNILGIETSCDETAVAVVRDGREILANIVSSQVALHAEYGGVVPELAAREHLRAIGPVTKLALEQSGLSLAEIDAIAATGTPGLIPALLVGTAYGKGLALALHRPYLSICHFIAHIYGSFLESEYSLSDRALYPLLALVVSGGHTALVLISVEGSARLIGRTLDDAAGEAYDKAAKILNLGYPGGPIIDRLSVSGDPRAYAFPRGLTGGGGKPLAEKNRFNFSFSGLKTALLYSVRDRELSESELADVAASYQEAIVDVLVRKTRHAAATFSCPTVCLCGGVACNRRLRRDMQSALGEDGRTLVLAPPVYCTDNAAMVAGLAYHHMRLGIGDGGDLGTGVSARLGEDLGVVPFAPGATSR